MAKRIKVLATGLGGGWLVARFETQCQRCGRAFTFVQAADTIVREQGGISSFVLWENCDWSVGGDLCDECIKQYKQRVQALATQFLDGHKPSTSAPQTAV